MHELSLLSDLLRKVALISQENGGANVVSVKVRLGALAHISPDHLREHYVDGTKGTIAEGSTLEIELNEDIHDPQAQDIVLDSVEVASAERMV